MPPMVGLESTTLKTLVRCSKHLGDPALTVTTLHFSFSELNLLALHSQDDLFQPMDSSTNNSDTIVEKPEG